MSIFKLAFHLLLLLCFLSLATTGFMKVFGGDSELLNRLHQGSGILLTLLVIAHLFMYRRVIEAMFRHGVR